MQQIPQVAYRLRDYEFNVYFKTALGAAIDISASTWEFTLRRKNSDLAPYLTSTTEVTIQDGPGGILFISFDDTDMVFEGGLMVAELVRTDLGDVMSGRWDVYVADEDETPEVINSVTVVSTANIVLQVANAPAGPAGSEIVGLTFVFDNGGSPVAPSTISWMPVPFDCTLNGATLTADTLSTTTIDVWVCAKADYPPTIADSITAADFPTLTAAIISDDLDISTWDVDVPAGSIIAAVVGANNNATKLNLSLTATKTN